MTWKKTTNDGPLGQSPAVGLSSGSWSGLNDSPQGFDVSASVNSVGDSFELEGLSSASASFLPAEDIQRVSPNQEAGQNMSAREDWAACDLSVTTDWVAYEDSVELAANTNNSGTPKTRTKNSASASTVREVADLENVERLHLGTGLATRVTSPRESSTQLDMLPHAVDGGWEPDQVPADLHPELEDTQHFEINQDLSEESAASSTTETELAHGFLKRWRNLPVVNRVAGSLLSSAEAGGKMVDHAVGLAFGSQTSLTSETQKLLHQRLGIATLLLFFGFFASLIVESFFFVGLNSRAEYLRFWSEVFLTTLMGLITWRLIANCPHVFRNLRLVELFVFGSAGWILALNSWVMLEQGATAKHAVSLAGPWVALVFTYALFIPNHWRRAMGVIVTMVVAPIAITILAAIFSPIVGRLAVESLDFTHGVVTLCLMSGFAAITATWGVYTIGSLRSEAYSAKQFGQYRLSRLLGIGGMGEVYVGEHLLLKRPCAIKVIKPQKANDPKMLERFEREVRSTAKLTHWNTVAIYDYGRADDGTFFYVMEYLPGLNLSQIVKLFGPMPPGRVAHLLIQICDALCEAHHQGMVHRDLKPANIFASKRGSKYDVAKLLDFGLVRRSVSRDGRGEAPGAAVGSPLFMSPEQATGQTMDHRSDIYSLGVTAFYLLTGRPPFTHKDPLKILRAHVREKSPEFQALGFDVPTDLARVIQRCMEKSPADRYPDVESLRQALLSCHCVSDWTWHHSAQWWKLHRCPEKSSLDHAIENDQLDQWLSATEKS